MQKVLFKGYVVLTVILFLWILFAWITGTFGDLFANIGEALQTMLKLVIIAIPPIILSRSGKRQNMTMLAIVFILLLTKLSFLCYLLFWQLATLNLATVLIASLALLVLFQMYTAFKSVRPDY